MTRMGRALQSQQIGTTWRLEQAGRLPQRQNRGSSKTLQWLPSCEPAGMTLASCGLPVGGGYQLIFLNRVTSCLSL